MYVNIALQQVYVCMCVYTCMCVLVYVDVCDYGMHVTMDVCDHCPAKGVCVYMCVYMCMYVTTPHQKIRQATHTCVCVCESVCPHIYAHTDTHIYTYLAQAGFSRWFFVSYRGAVGWSTAFAAKKNTSL